jgi:pimeloyl-ACP methyl ester carboxylesterase
MAIRWGRSEFTDAAGTRMHAAVLGAPGGPDVVCVHGLGCSHRYFRPLARCLAPHAPTLGLVLARDYLDCGPRRWLRTFRVLLDDPVEHKLRHLRVPTVVVRGSRDPTVPRAWAEEVVALLPDGRLAEVPGAGHTLNYSAPDELATIVRPLLAQHQHNT